MGLVVPLLHHTRPIMVANNPNRDIGFSGFKPKLRIQTQSCGCQGHWIKNFRSGSDLSYRVHFDVHKHCSVLHRRALTQRRPGSDSIKNTGILRKLRSCPVLPGRKFFLLNRSSEEEGRKGADRFSEKWFVLLNRPQSIV